MMFLAAMVFAVTGVSGQTSAEDYFVKTKNVVEQKKQEVRDSTAEAQEKARDVMNELFPRLNLCEWNDGMRFLVMPEKRDLVIRVFYDGITNNSVGTMQLRHKIMIYKGHSHHAATNRDRINFMTADDNHPYYYEVPSGTFDDYCNTKYGVPSLAYLGDVETARRELMGKTLVTKTRTYYVDTSYGEGFDEVEVPLETEVRVVKVGVGTRQFPVKIIVSDKDGREFFQNVAISRTNSGLRDDEFNMMDNQFHTFNSAFDMMGDYVMPSWHYKDYIGKKVFLRHATKMTDSRGTQSNMSGLTTFKIVDIKSQRGTGAVKMTLCNLTTGANYLKEVYFKDTPGANVVVGKRDNIYEDLFAEGTPGNIAGVRQKNMAAIRQGQIKKGFTETEVRLVRPDDYEVLSDSDTSYIWQFSSPDQKFLRVTFDKRTRLVVSTYPN